MLLFLQQKRLIQTLLYSVAVFIFVMVAFVCAVDTLWFREDDLGTIINGLIRSWDDFLRVFSSDCRSFITPVNYQRTTPNVISGFLRPMQNVFFSVIYYFCGPNVYAFYYTHVALHALNAVMMFCLIGIFLPAYCALSASLLFAFYPDVAWLPWIGTLQNSLATFFLLGTLLCFVRSLHGSFLWYYGAGFLFLCSLLSREIAILLPVWFVMVIFFMHTDAQSLWLIRLKKACQGAWIFFAANVVYIAMRWWSFGTETLPRTLNNILLQYPKLAYLLQYQPVKPLTATARQGVTVVIESPEASMTTRVIDALLRRFWPWVEVLFSWLPRTPGQRVAALVTVALLIVFMLYAYRHSKRVFVLLVVGMMFVAWPGIVAYPSPRYLNMVYPFFITLMVYGVYVVAHERTVLARTAALLIAVGMLVLGVEGYFNNCSHLHRVAAERYVYKKRFDDFFAQHTFAPGTSFVVVSSPFVSDIQSIFQVYLGDFSTSVVYDPFATLAERGIMGCRSGYVVQGVASNILPIAQGFRLVSSDKKQCGWWLRMSHFPVTFLKERRSYQWTTNQYQVGRWYDCSVGSFYIHEMNDNDCATDVSFVFDQQWVRPQTVFVAWDTMDGCYKIIPSDHMIVS